MTFAEHALPFTPALSCCMWTPMEINSESEEREVKLIQWNATFHVKFGEHSTWTSTYISCPVVQWLRLVWRQCHLLRQHFVPLKAFMFLYMIKTISLFLLRVNGLMDIVLGSFCQLFSKYVNYSQ